MSAKETIAIVGAGQAGLQAAQSLRQGGFEGRLVLIGDEPHHPYQRPPLSKAYLSGEIGTDRLALKADAFYSEADIDCLLGITVRELDAAAGQMTLSDGTVLAFDKALLATGSSPRALPVPGADLDGVVTLRTIADVDAMRAYAVAGKRVIVIGGGYIGLEVAAVARKLGLEVTVLEAFDRVMARATSEPISRFYEDLHRSQGVTMALGAGVKRIEQGTGGLIVHTDAESHEADLVLVGIGAAPSTGLAEAAGLDVENGIVVDATCRTSAPSVFAAGDCAVFPSARYGRAIRLESVQNAIDQAKAAAAAMLGSDKPYDPVPWFWSDQYDLKLQIAGLGQDADDHVVRGDPGSRKFSVVYLKDSRLRAIDAVSVPRDYMMVRKLLATDHMVDRAALADPSVPIADAVSSTGG